MVACARAVSLAGFKPVFCDCGEDKNLDADSMIGVMRKNTVAVLCTHVYGRRCNMESVHQTIQTWYPEVLVVEDLSEAHGIQPHPDTAAACWSFYRNKVVSGEEGGAVVFNKRHQDKNQVARELRCLGFNESQDYLHRPRGHNYRLANLLAEPIRQSLREYYENLHKREQVVCWYDEYCPDEWKQGQREVPWVYDIRIRELEEEQLDRLVFQLKTWGIAARHGFKPMTLQKEYEHLGMSLHQQGRAYTLKNEILTLPINPQITEEECKLAFDTILWVVSTFP